MICSNTHLFLVGCDANVLGSSNVSLGKLSEQSAEFGAEQVILVHDEAEKKRLQREIGNVALILTILQSKGMEFDDVILWNFFTDCPFPAGLRALKALSSNEATAIFDSRKNLVRIYDAYREEKWDTNIWLLAYVLDTQGKYHRPTIHSSRPDSHCRVSTLQSPEPEPGSSLWKAPMVTWP